MVKSFVREKTEIAKFDETARKVQAIFTKGERYVALNNPLMQICIYGVMIFLLTQAPGSSSPPGAGCWTLASFPPCSPTASRSWDPS